MGDASPAAARRRALLRSAGMLGDCSHVWLVSSRPALGRGNKTRWIVTAASRAPARGPKAKLERRLQAAPHCGAMQLAAQRRGCAIPDKIPSQADKSSIQGNIQSPAANAALSGSLSGAEREHPRSFSLLQYHISFVLASLTATQDRPSPFPRDRAPRRRPPRRRAGRPGNTG